MSIEKDIAELIANEVSWFNGWKASEEMFNESCRKAARKVIKRLTKRTPDAPKRGWEWRTTAWQAQRSIRPILSVC